MPILNINPTAVLIEPCQVELSETQLDFLRNSTQTMMNGVSVTKNHNILGIPELNNIKTEIERICNLYLHDIYGASKDVYLTITTSVYANTKNGMAQRIHKHSNSIVAGCMYITKPNNSPLKILCNHSMFREFNFEFPIDHETVYNQGMISIDANPKDVVIFPGHLFHYVDNPKDEFREVIGFSAFVFGDFNKSKDNWSSIPQIVDICH